MVSKNTVKRVEEVPVTEASKGPAIDRELACLDERPQMLGHTRRGGCGGKGLNRGPL